ncbi:PIN domain-containing protein [Peribacillus butanolivorans]|uniref:PIN domain-containing protein n=1 Tax=Peribacillus butanolivorans TaxID=421767 RepID=UPI0036DC24D9
MNIFLDTTVTFSDPFFKKNFNRNLLKLARDYKDFIFYMSEIVYKETKRHFEINITKSLEELKKTENQLQNYQSGYFTKTWDVNERIDKMMKDFESYYEELQKEDLLCIIPCPNNILPELIDRAVNRIKPFKEKKSEFRDAATWLTYAKYTEENNLADCYFITENVSDFYDDNKENLHPDLLKDSTKFKPFLTLVKLAQEDEKIKLYIEEKRVKEQEVNNWIEDNNIDENYVLGYFDESSYNGLYNEINHLCSDYLSSLNDYRSDGVYLEGEYILDSMDIEEIQDFNIEVIAEEIIVSGELVIEVSCTYQGAVKFDEYNDLNVDFAPKFLVGLLQPFSFTLFLDKSITNLQLEEIGMVSKDIIDPGF